MLLLQVDLGVATTVGSLIDLGKVTVFGFVLN